MKRFLMAISDGPFSGTGFSEQMRHILFGLAQTGQFEISWQCLQHMGYPYELCDNVFPDLPHKGSSIKVYGTYGDPYHFGADAFLKNYRDINPEMVLFMGDPKNIAPYIGYKVKLGFPLIMYCTLDGLPIHPSWIDTLDHVNLFVAMTEWAAEEYHKVGFSPAWIHHGINSDWWKVTSEEKYAIRKKYGIRDNTVVFVNWDIPQHRKRTDALLRCWKEFNPLSKNAVLILYTDWNLERSLGWNVEDLIKQYNVPRQTILSPVELQGNPKFYDCAERPERVKEIACMGDVYASATSGEGFGMCGLEAMAMKIPVIITDYAASSEVHKKGSILVPCYEGRAGRFRLDDRRRSVESGVVNEELLTQALNKLYSDKNLRDKLGEEALAWSSRFDFDKQIIKKWQGLLGPLNTDLIAAKELLNI
jgi:glycosyltransferase involved in cell wall biosynthesis